MEGERSRCGERPEPTGDHSPWRRGQHRRRLPSPSAGSMVQPVDAGDQSQRDRERHAEGEELGVDTEQQGRQHEQGLQPESPDWVDQHRREHRLEGSCRSERRRQRAANGSEPRHHTHVAGDRGRVGVAAEQLPDRAGPRRQHDQRHRPATPTGTKPATSTLRMSPRVPGTAQLGDRTDESGLDAPGSRWRSRC